MLSTSHILQGLDWTLPFHLSSDASNTVVGDMLGQGEDKKPYVIYYTRKNLSQAELN